MLGFIHGKVISKNTDTSSAIILCSNVGYEIVLSKKSLEALVLHSEATLWIHTHVREDALILFGFLSETEKSFFRVLLGMSGLGPKTALSLLSEHGAERLSQLIIEKKTAEISTAPGVGKKLSEKIVLELSSKVEKLQWVTQLEKLSHETEAGKPKARQLRDDLNSALVNLGYQQSQIKIALDRLFDTKYPDSFDFETGLKFALSEISGRRTSVQEAGRAGNA